MVNKEKMEIDREKKEERKKERKKERERRNGDRCVIYNLRPRSEVVWRYIPEPKARGILLQTTND